MQLGHRLVGGEGAPLMAGVYDGASRIRRRSPSARLAWARDRDAGSAVRRDRPRALVVRERAAAERAHQARPRPASVPRQVPAAARRGADRAATARRAGLVLDPFCGSGTTLVEAVGLGRDAVGCDVSAFNALLAREKTRVHDPAEVAAGLAATLARAEDALAAGAPAGRAPAYLARVVRRRGAARAARLPRRDRARERLERARVARADARGALGAARAPRRARRRPRARARALLVPQAPPHAACRRSAPLRFLRRYSGDVADARRGLRRAAAGGRAARASTTSTCASCASSAPPTRSSPRRPTSA